MRKFFCALVLLAPLAVGGGCRPSSASMEDACTLSDDGGALDATGRRDGIYGVTDGQLERAPLASADHVRRTSAGVDPASGKRWVRMRVGETNARVIEAFTAEPEGKGIALVVDGRVASVHRVREAITSDALQVSCCDPRACERWIAVTRAE